MRRSMPGLGRIVGLYYLHTPEEPTGQKGALTWRSSIGEDFADSDTPVVIKAKADVSREQLIAHLTELLNHLKSGRLFRAIDADKTPPPPGPVEGAE